MYIILFHHRRIKLVFDVKTTKKIQTIQKLNNTFVNNSRTKKMEFGNI